MVNSQLASDADITRVINTQLTELYDVLVAAGPPDYYLKTSTITTVSGTTAYTLPTDFRSLVAVLAPVLDGTSRQYRVDMFDESQRSYYQPPQAAVQLTLEYVPAPPVLALDADVFDGVSGWDELIVLLSARQLLRKQRRDVSDLDRAIAELRARVVSLAPQRQLAGPLYVNDGDDRTGQWFWAGVPTNIAGWRLVGNGATATLQLYSAAFYW